MNPNSTSPPLQRWLVWIWAALTATGLFVEVWKYVLHGGRTAWVRFLGLSYEQNLPTWYASSLLLICSVVLVLIARAKQLERDRFRWHWYVLSAGFAYISLDETATIHEGWSNWFHLDGIFHFGWVIPAGLIVLGLGVFYWPFLRHLPSRPRRQFVTAGALYVGGALLVELLLGYWTDIAGSHNIVYGLIDLVEESAELLGVTLFLLALLEYGRKPLHSLRLQELDQSARHGGSIVS